MTEQFKIDVDNGLSSVPKTLPSKYFYDKIGDELFVKIMNMPEYYPTRAEFEIFKEQSDQMIEGFELSSDGYFELIELGAGDGTKTIQLLKTLHSGGYQFDYLPVDISHHALDLLEKNIAAELPELEVNKKQGDYFKILDSLKESHHPKVVLFLGSNIGNMTDEQATAFIYELGKSLRKGDRLLIGADLIKSEAIVLPAYNDAAGITKEFNLNLLNRINNELGGQFDVESFVHQPEYNAETGIAHSYLVSRIDQEVTIESTGKAYRFEHGEKIKTEISRKYNDEIMNTIIAKTSFVMTHKLMDKNNYFADYIFKRD